MKIRPIVLILFVLSAGACTNAQTPQPAPVQTTDLPKTESPAPTPAVTPAVAATPAAPAVKLDMPKPKKQAAQPVQAEPVKTAEPAAALLKVETPPHAAPVAPPHEAWDALLQKFVNADGVVDYKGFKNDKAGLEAYLKTLADNPVQTEWSREEKMAYWINAYNAFTVKLIVDNYPTKSILNFDGGKTWDVKRIALGGKKYSLNQIENDILRPQFKDPRIHFAVNCAARSCPPLYNHAFTAANLESDLEARAEAFINNVRFNTISTSRAKVSKIFEWYAADFGDLRKYLNKYAKVPLNASSTISYNEYDWDLNE